jgi:hypothetical protein
MDNTRPRKHVPPDFNNPNDPSVAEALVRKCDQCKAPAGELCQKRAGFQEDLAGRVIHVGRRQPPN